MENVNEIIGEKIKSIRKALGYNQEELAALLDLSRTSVVNIECGRQSLTIENLYKMVERLKVSPNELLPFGETGSVNIVLEAQKKELQEERDMWKNKCIEIKQAASKLNELLRH